jgi:hypothetical protein
VGRRAGVALLALAVLVGCGHGSAQPGGPAGSTAPGAPAARVGLIDRLVEVRATGTASYGAAADQAPLSVGDAVRTDATGFGEVDYADGSVTRLDSSTELSVVALHHVADVHQTRVRMDSGRTWHRVTKLSNSESSFEVETRTAVAAVRGTAFVVDCRTPVCTVTVVEGTVDVRSVATGQHVSVPAGDQVAVPDSGAVPLRTTPALPDDGWTAKNLARDAAAGATAVPTASAPTSADAGAAVVPYNPCALVLPSDVTNEIGSQTGTGRTEEHPAESTCTLLPAGGGAVRVVVFRIPPQDLANTFTVMTSDDQAACANTQKAVSGVGLRAAYIACPTLGVVVLTARAVLAVAVESADGRLQRDASLHLAQIAVQRAAAFAGGVGVGSG